MYCFYSLVPRPHQHITWKGALVTIDTFLSPTYIDLEIEIPSDHTTIDLHSHVSVVHFF